MPPSLQRADLRAALLLATLLGLGCAGGTGCTELPGDGVEDASRTQRRDAGAIGAPDAGEAGAEADGGADGGEEPWRDAGPTPVGARWVRVPPTPVRQWEEDFPPPCRLRDSAACYAQRFTGGVAARDLDGDGRIDLYLTRMEAPDQVLFNTPAGFVERAVPGLGAVEHSNGAAFADIDNDGDPDLMLSTTGGDRFYLFLNDGRGAFTEEAEARGAAQIDPHLHGGMSLCFGDYDLDGYLDLHTTEWRGPIFMNTVDHNRLMHNLGAASPGRFEDVTAALGVGIHHPRLMDGSREGDWGFTSQILDLDADGWPELLIAADFHASHLFFGEGRAGGAGPTFTDVTRSAGVGTDENGMGSAAGDYDGDGDLDWFVSSIYDPTCTTQTCYWGSTGNRLYRNEGGRRFTDVTAEAGLEDGGWAWGARFFDYDLDGDLDLVVANGVRFVSEASGFLEENVRLYENEGGRFTDRSEELGLIDRVVSRAVLPLDYDGDGDEDLFITHNGAPPMLWRNEVNEGNAWLVVRPVGTRSNRDGYGAVVWLWPTEGSAPMVRHMGNGCGFLGNDQGLPRFGLGDLERVYRLKVLWPRTGEVQEFEDLPTRQELVVVEPE